MKIAKEEISNKPMQYVDSQFYEYYIAIDWSSKIMSIAWMRSNSLNPKVDRDLPAKLKTIKEYLKKFTGKKILTIEETTGAQWLYVELKDFVEKIVICDPSRNSLLKEGPKNDPKDAASLCRLLRAGLLKEIYHGDDENYQIRKLVSSYDDLVQASVRAKNQLSAIYRSYGLDYKKDTVKSEDPYIKHVIEEKLRTLELYEEEKKKYISLFKEVKKRKNTVKILTGISGIDTILAVKIFSIVIEANRFADKYKYWSYSGLVKYKMESGGHSYGKKNTKYSRKLKVIYKVATVAALRGHNDIREYYEHMLKEGLPAKEAVNTVCRYIATSTYAMMKNNTEYKPYNWRK